MILHRTSVGAGPVLVVLHGMLGQGRNWQRVARLLSPRLCVITPDLRNHGASLHGEPMDYPTMADDVAETLDHEGIQAAAVLGHSMGGKVAMTLALSEPRRVRRLVVVDTAPVSYAPQNLPLIRAMRAVDLEQTRGRADVDQALAAAVPDPTTRAFLLQGLERGEGRLYWRCNLEVMERSMPLLSGFPPFAPENAYAGPTLFVAGARSDHVLPEYGPLIARLFPAARVVRVPDAGHWVHADQPEKVAAILAEFVSRSI